MATRRTRPVAQQAYVYGNTVRKTQRNVPVGREQEGQGRGQKRSDTESHAIRRNREKALHMNLPYVLLLTVAAICALSICVNYLQVKSDVDTRIDNIERLEKELEALKSENDVLETRLNRAVDLNRVFQIATEELGMVYANKKQVLRYDRTESEYVRQYEDIPKQ